MDILLFLFIYLNRYLFILFTILFTDIEFKFYIEYSKI